MQSHGTRPLTIPTEYLHALEDFLGFSLNDRKRLHRIAEEISKLSRGLTLERDSTAGSSYLNDASTREAYLVYYTTTNLLKLWPPLRELARSGFFNGREVIRHLDLGTGTGAALWGMTTYLRNEQPQVSSLVSQATDNRSQNLRTVEQFAAGFLRHLIPFELKTFASIYDLSVPGPTLAETHDLITLMNVLNEVGEPHDPAIIAMLQSRIAAGGAIVMIEPASREESRRALRFRDRMEDAGFHVYSPCCRTGGCPALGDNDNWCHTEIPWQRPDFIKAIDDEVGTLRLSLKSTYAVFMRENLNLSEFPIQSAADKRSFDSVNLPAPLPSGPGSAPIDSAQDDTRIGSQRFFTVGRIVSERFDEKGRVRMFICNERGRNEYIMNKRDRSVSNREALKAERYDLVQIEGVEERPHDVKIGKETVFHTLSRADGCGIVDNFD